MDTHIQASLKIEPPLNETEVSYLREFASSRRCRRAGGPYSTALLTTDFTDEERFDAAGDGQPGLWCTWMPSDDGTQLLWSMPGCYANAEGWLTYLIEHFLAPGGKAQDALGFEGFSFNHAVNGSVQVYGSEGMSWTIDVANNKPILNTWL